MIEELDAAQFLACHRYPRKTSKILQYGTAGFRDDASILQHVTYRMGLLAVLRSKAKCGATVGLMITASHNPENDNGVKLCDPDSKMLEKEWEDLATELINADDNSIHDILYTIVKNNNILYDFPACVFLGRDTRQSSESLLAAACIAVQCLKGKPIPYGLVTTPQLHFMVYCRNFGYYGTATEEGYYMKFLRAFETLWAKSHRDKYRYTLELYVDGANGVGGIKFSEIDRFLCTLNVTVFNDGTNGILNHRCGADFVKVEQKPPEGILIESGKRYASFDGDADRLVYYFKDDNDVFHLLDGDKIASLIAKFLKMLVDKISLKLDMRVIQTAYANGSSTQYIKNVLKIPVICVPTGVKHLHHEALKYDIGIYFEANGHGTVVFGKEIKQAIKDLVSDKSATTEQREAAEEFVATINLINETVGDAISDLMLVEAILHYLDWNCTDWDNLYKDLPNRQLKVKIPDRNLITTIDAERKCVKPAGLQDAIDSTVLDFENARSFVRPSGTEDIVRVYAEAATQEQADKLAEEVKKLVEKFS